MSDPTAIHQVLWTGGWDSTFRVAELVLVHGRAVQPWYVADPERRTTEREIEVMADLAHRMRQVDPDAGRLLLPVRIVALADLPPDEAVSASAQRVGAQYPMGAQYGWLPRLVPLAGWQVLEFSHENDGRYKFVPLASFRRNPAPAPDDWFVVDESACDADRYRVFGGFRYPVLDVTKRQMAQRARSGGFEAILDQAWSCRWPTLRGTPCGQCSPCRQIREAGLTDRVPPDTAVRRTVHRWHWDWVRRGESARIRARSIRARLARR